MSDSNMKYCMQCGEEIVAAAELCPECGVKQELSNISSDEKHCTSCGESINIQAEICPECGVAQPTGGTSIGEDNQSSFDEEVSSAGEAFSLMVSYYRENSLRGITHIVIGLFTGGVWLAWFFWFWLGTYMNWKDMEKLRRIHQGGSA